jgi:hypothetical protein
VHSSGCILQQAPACAYARAFPLSSGVVCRSLHWFFLDFSSAPLVVDQRTVYILTTTPNRYMISISDPDQLTFPE